MKVKVSSFHYRLFEAYRALKGCSNFTDVNLCAYTRGVLAGLVILIGWFVIGVAFIYLLVLQWMFFLTLALCTAVSAGVVFQGYWIIDKIDKRLEKKQALKPGSFQKVNNSFCLMRAWLKAKKERVCPLIEFVDRHEK